MKSKLIIITVSLLSGIIFTVSVYEYAIVPLRLKRIDSYSIGQSKAIEQVVEKIQAEFGLIEKVSPETQVLVSTNKKVVVIENKDSTKTLSVYERTNH